MSQHGAVLFSVAVYSLQYLQELQLDLLSCAKRVRQRLTYQEKSTNLQSKEKKHLQKFQWKMIYQRKNS